MTGKELQEILDQYKGWTGSRAEMIAIIEKIENANPASRMLQSKKAPYKLLPVNPRRIQWFTSKDIIPKPEGHRYYFEHLLFYWAAIRLRKREKLQFAQIAGLALRENTQSILRLLSEESATADTGNLAANLKHLGRPEGRALVSRLLKLSITPWCHVIIDESRAEQLRDADISVLTKEINLSLLDQVRKLRSVK
jgi:hypothetical protein